MEAVEAAKKAGKCQAIKIFGKANLL